MNSVEKGIGGDYRIAITKSNTSPTKTYIVSENYTVSSPEAVSQEFSIKALDMLVPDGHLVRFINNDECRAILETPDGIPFVWAYGYSVYRNLTFGNVIEFYPRGNADVKRYTSFNDTNILKDGYE